jgi:hypothetical protein
VPSDFFIDPAVQAKLTPLALEPIVADKPWGSTGHASFNAPSGADSRQWGEIWLACEDFGLNTRIASGPHRGQAPGWFKANWGIGLTGHRPNPALPALTVSVRLERTGKEPGPVRALSGEELWCVLEAGVESWVAAGAAPEGPWPKRLKKTPVEAGDNFVIPPGLIRCQGPTMTVLKVLPTGSLVQTLFDWDRPPDPWDFTPPPRPVDIVDGDLVQLKPVLERRDRVLYRGPLYEAILVRTSFATGRGDGLSIICPFKGRARLQSTGGAQENLRLHPGQAILIPAGLQRWSVESGTLVSYLHIRLA